MRPNDLGAMVMPFEIREADPRDAPALSALAQRAKAHLGYSDEWLRIWSGDLTISSDCLTTNRGFVAVAEGAPVGVCVLESEGSAGTLEHLWIAPESQRVGVGRALVTRALETAARAGAVRVSVLSDPFAEAFYLRLGARRVGSVPAPMPGSPERMLPRLEFTMTNPDSRVTIHMAASLDGFIARKDGRVDWLETSDEFAGGDTMDPGFVEAFLKTIDCYVMGSRTYETALRFEAQGFGWAYGDTPTFVLTSRELPRTRDTVEFHSGDLAPFVNGRLRPTFCNIWFAGGGMVSAECLRLGLADEVRYSILPILIGDGIPFFEKLDGDIALHLAEVKAFKSGMVALRYEVQGRRTHEL